MIGRPRRALIAAAVLAYVAVHIVLAVAHAQRPVLLGPYLLGLALVTGASVTVLVRPPQRLRRAWASAILLAVLAGVASVLSVLPDGRASYALWYPSLVPVPLGAIAIAGFPIMALAGITVITAATMAWTQMHADGGFAEGLFRTTTPLAAVVVCVGIWWLMRSSRLEVQRAHAAQVAEEEVAARLHAREVARSERLADVTRIAEPVLTRLADGEVVTRRLSRESALLEGALRDGIRARSLLDPSVSAAAWAARSRGVRVVLLDDGPALAPGAGPAEPLDKARDLLREVLVRVLETMSALDSTGTVTARLVPQPAEAMVGRRPAGSIVLQCPDAVAVVAAAVPAWGLRSSVVVEADLDPQLPEEAVITVSTPATVEAPATVSTPAAVEASPTTGAPTSVDLRDGADRIGGDARAVSAAPVQHADLTAATGAAELTPESG